MDKFETSYWEGVVVAMMRKDPPIGLLDYMGRSMQRTSTRPWKPLTMKTLEALFPYITYTKTNHEGSFKGRIVQIHEDMTYSPMTNFFVPGKEKVQVLKVPEIK